MKDLIKVNNRLPEMKSYINVLLQLINKWDNALVFRYEDLIDGKFSQLEKYLDHKLPKSIILEKHRRVIRSKNYGNWKNWFLEDDLNIVNDKFNDYMEKFGYNKDQKLNNVPIINSEHSSLYVKKLMAERIKKKIIF